MPGDGSDAIDFGAFPGSPEATKDVTASGVLTSSLVEAWLLPIATADHSIDEHVMVKDSIEIIGRCETAGTIRVVGTAKRPQQQRQLSENGENGAAERHLLHGLFTFGWAWK